MTDNAAHDLTGKLNFDTDKGAGRSKWIAILLALLLIGWMGSGFIFPSEAEEETAEDNAPRVVTVAVMNSMAKVVDLVLTAEGQSTPDRSAIVRAEAGGQVISVLVSRGDLVVARQKQQRMRRKLKHWNYWTTQSFAHHSRGA